MIAGTGLDVVQALRASLRAPGFTLAVAMVLGLGVGATTTLFALVDVVLLRPLPYDQPDRLAMIWESSVSQDRVREGPSPGNAIDWVVRSDAFDALTAWMTASATLRGGDGGVPVTGVQVTAGFFDVFRRQPFLGRTFAADEYQGARSIASSQSAGGEPVLVMSHRLWRDLGADPQMVGSTVHVEGREWRVVGVMPSDFAVPDSGAAFWAPWDMAERYRGALGGPPRDFRFLRVAGRIRSDLSHEGATARMKTLAARLEAEHPRTNAGWSVQVVPLADEIARTSRLDLLVVFGAVSCLLLLVCANVASLAVARAASRRREMAIRLALGAGRSHIVRQLAAESAVCAVLTTVVALLLTLWWLDATIAFAPADMPRLHEVRFDGRIASFAAVLAVLVTMISAVVPSLRASRTPVATALKDGAPVSARASGLVRRGLVVAEIAGAVMLVVGGGLLARSFAALQRVDHGFNATNLLVLRITPDAERYRTGQQATDYYRRVLDSLREIPAVESAAAVTVLPMSALGADFDRPYWPEGPRPEGDTTPEADIRTATPGYFTTLGLPLRSGREFTDGDNADAPRVVVINESLARQSWGPESPVGRTLMLDYQGGAYSYLVIGVVRDARYRGPRSEARPEIFMPHAQNPYLVLNVIARTIGDPAAVAQMARAQAHRVDPDQPVHSVTTMERLIDEATQQDRFAMLLVTLFAIAGLLTAATGVYALLAYTVAQRRREIAVRMAIGASPGRVARLIVTESLMLAMVGGTLGAIGAAAGSRVARSLLFGIAPQDPLTLGMTALVLVVVVLAASWLPARRAAMVNPVSAMKI